MTFPPSFNATAPSQRKLATSSYALEKVFIPDFRATTAADQSSVVRSNNSSELMFIDGSSDEEQEQSTMAGERGPSGGSGSATTSLVCVALPIVFVVVGGAPVLLWVDSFMCLWNRCPVMDAQLKVVVAIGSLQPLLALSMTGVGLWRFVCKVYCSRNQVCVWQSMTAWPGAWFCCVSH